MMVDVMNADVIPVGAIPVGAVPASAIAEGSAMTMYVLFIVNCYGIFSLNN